MSYIWPGYVISCVKLVTITDYGESSDDQTPIVDSFEWLKSIRRVEDVVVYNTYIRYEYIALDYNIR